MSQSSIDFKKVLLKVDELREILVNFHLKGKDDKDNDKDNDNDDNDGDEEEAETNGEQGCENFGKIKAEKLIEGKKSDDKFKVLNLNHYQVLHDCKLKSYEILTQLANLDWELNEYEESLVNYLTEMRDLLAPFNMELSLLYGQQLDLVRDNNDKFSDNDLQTSFNLEKRFKLTINNDNFDNSDNCDENCLNGTSLLVDRQQSTNLLEFILIRVHNLRSLSMLGQCQNPSDELERLRKIINKCELNCAEILAHLESY